MKHTQKHRNIYIITGTVVAVLVSLLYSSIAIFLLGLFGAVIPSVGFWLLAALIFLKATYRAFQKKHLDDGAEKIAEILNEL